MATSFPSKFKGRVAFGPTTQPTSETVYGVQVARSTLAPKVAVLAKECSSGIDFVGLNCMCPRRIDLAFRMRDDLARTFSFLLIFK